MSEILWRRLRYFLTPQWDLYAHIAPHLKGHQTLEVGFGTGIGTIQLAYYAYQVTAIEDDPQCVTFVRKVLPLANVNWKHFNVLEYPERDTFDSVVMIEVLEHILAWRTALSNVHDALLEGGKLYITARNVNADLRRNELHEREWTAQELVEGLSLFFSKVQLFDYRLETELETTTHVTPLLAVATK